MAEQRLASVARAVGALLPAVAAGAALLAEPWFLVVAVVGLAIWLVGARGGRQAAAVAWTGLATLPRRIGAASVVVVGIAGVVGVLVALQAMAEGFQATLRGTGRDDAAIVLRAGANTELSSGLDRATIRLITQAPGVLPDAQGVPIASAEVVVIANVPKRATGTDANAEVRGVGPRVWALRPQVHIVEGRAFTPGLRELVVGTGARRQFSGLEPGSTLQLNNQAWTVVGVFASGDAHDSEIWGDAESVASAYRRNAFQSVTLRLTSPDALDGVKQALTGDPRLRVDVETTRSYYSRQSEQLTRIIRILGIGIAVIMAFGAAFGALNTMYAAVAARAREIATLRALGFGGLPVVVAVMLETMLLALAGGLIGAAVAWAVFNGYTVSTLGSNFSQVVFQFRVTPTLLVQGLQWALVIGLAGGLPPALRAAALPVTAALRES
jgi:putative ABC transport system permease protein